MAFTREDIQFMASKGWDLQPDGVTFRDRSFKNTRWIEHRAFGWKMLQVDDETNVVKEVSQRFDSPIAVVVSMEIDRSNNQ